MKFKTDKSIDDWVENHRKKVAFQMKLLENNLYMNLFLRQSEKHKVLNVCVVIKILNFGIYKYL